MPPCGLDSRLTDTDSHRLISTFTDGTQQVSKVSKVSKVNQHKISNPLCLTTNGTNSKNGKNGVISAELLAD